MAFTYNTGLTGSRDLIRLRIGDIDENEMFLTDEAIDSINAQYPGHVKSCIQCVLAILAVLARKVDRSAAGINSSRSQKFQHYKDLLAELKEELRLGNVQAYAGGMDTGRIEDMRSDTSYPQQPFSVGMDDNRRG